MIFPIEITKLERKSIHRVRVIYILPEDIYSVSTCLEFGMIFITIHNDVLRIFMNRIHSGSVVSNGTQFAMSYFTLSIRAFSIVRITITYHVFLLSLLRRSFWSSFQPDRLKRGNQ